MSADSSLVAAQLHNVSRPDDDGTTTGVIVTRPTQLDPRYVNRRASLPYGLRVEEVEKAVSETYRLLHGVNDYLVGAGFLFVVVNVSVAGVPPALSKVGPSPQYHFDCQGASL